MISGKDFCSSSEVAMKDTRSSDSVMNDSFRPVGTCSVSRAAEDPRQQHQYYHHQQQQQRQQQQQQQKPRHVGSSEWFDRWEHPTKGHASMRIGDAPNDTQGATEPGEATKPAKHELAFVGMRIKQESDETKLLGGAGDCIYHTGIASVHPISPKDRYKETRTRAEVLGQSTTSGDTRSHPTVIRHGRDTPPPQAESSRTSQQNISTTSPPLTCKREPGLVGQSATTPHPAKSSNMSAIERQRGPLKKRRIHYVPDAIDPCAKRTKQEPDSKDDDETSYVDGAQTLHSSRSTETFSSLQSHPQGDVAIGHEEKHTANNPDIIEKNVFLLNDHSRLVKQRTETKVTHPGNADRGVIRQETSVPPAVFNFNLADPVNLFPVHVRNYQSRSLLVPLFQNRELVRLWLQHTAQSSELFPVQSQPREAGFTPDVESNHSSTASDLSQGSVSSKSKSKNAARSSGVAPAKPAKAYACDYCPSTFKHRHHVMRHMRAHNGERPFHCEDCGATFARKCVLTNHRRTHTGEKPYICAECGDTFSRKHHLVIHQRTHSGEKPYRCPDCGTAFSRSHHMNRHCKTHERTPAGQLPHCCSTSPGEIQSAPPTMTDLAGRATNSLQVAKSKTVSMSHLSTVSSPLHTGIKIPPVVTNSKYKIAPSVNNISEI